MSSLALLLGGYAVIGDAGDGPRHPRGAIPGQPLPGGPPPGVVGPQQPPSGESTVPRGDAPRRPNIVAP